MKLFFFCQNTCFQNLAHFHKYNGKIPQNLSLSNHQSRLQKGKYILPFGRVTDGREEANFIGFSHEYGILVTFLESFTKKVKFIEQFYEINLFTTVCHGCKGENILRNHDPWLQSRNN